MKEPHLVIKAHENRSDFTELINTLRDADPEIVLAGITFWHKVLASEILEQYDELK